MADGGYGQMATAQQSDDKWAGRRREGRAGGGDQRLVTSSPTMRTGTEGEDKKEDEEKSWG